MSPTAGELWYIRAYAQDQQVLLAIQSTFLRADWVAAAPAIEVSWRSDRGLQTYCSN